uniref:Putative secreted protein n=2 Tax=Anopheles triannulatus TaxID=58253 RepID=A0A2M4B2V5_9DIPT
MTMKMGLVFIVWLLTMCDVIRRCCGDVRRMGCWLEPVAFKMTGSQLALPWASVAARFICCVTEQWRCACRSLVSSVRRRMFSCSSSILRCCSLSWSSFRRMR